MGNCVLCGTGSAWWFKIAEDKYQCPICGGDPSKGGGRADWQAFHRARMVAMFGTRRQGDEELFRKYEDELKCYL